MGFGLLFIGYFFLIFFPLSRIGVLPNIAIVGCIIMLFGLKKLAHYCSENRAFSVAKILGIVLSAVSIVALMLDIAEIDGMLTAGVNAVLAPMTNMLYSLTITSFTASLFTGVYKLSGEVELPKLAKRSAFILSANAAYLVAEIAAGGCSLVRTYIVSSNDSFTIVTGYIGIIAFLLAYAILFLNLAHIFSCYMHICLEGDEDMPNGVDAFDKIVAWTKRRKK